MKDPQWAGSQPSLSGLVGRAIHEESKVWDQLIAEIVIPPDFYFASAKNRLRG